MSPVSVGPFGHRGALSWGCDSAKLRKWAGPGAEPPTCSLQAWGPPPSCSPDPPWECRRGGRPRRPAPLSPLAPRWDVPLRTAAGEGGRTFAAGHGRAPDHVPVLPHARDGLGALRLDKAIVTVERNRTAKQEPVPETPPVDGDARVVALVLTER